MSLPKTAAQLLALSIASSVHFSTALAFELGSCTLIEVRQEASGKADELLIPVEVAVFEKKIQATEESDMTKQTELTDFSFDSGSEFNTSDFTMPIDTSTSEDTGLLDLTTDSSGY